MTKTAPHREGATPPVKALANKGQGGDNMIAHLTGGEAIIPREVLMANPELGPILHNAFSKIGAQPEKFIAGSPSQSINPKTGLPEFSFWSSIAHFALPVIGSAAGFALGGPAGAAAGGALGTSASNGFSTNPTALVQDALGGVGGYVGGGSILNGAQAVGNSAVDALGGTGTFGTGQTIGDLFSGFGSSAPATASGGLLTNGATPVGQAVDLSTNAAGALTAPTAAAGGGTVGAVGTPAAAIASKLSSAPTWLGPAASIVSGGLQYAGNQAAINEENKIQQQTQANEAPFINAGQTAATNESNLINSPTAQLNYVQNNPFFNSLKDQATNTLLANEAAQGKVGSGGTAKALQDELLQLGTGLVNNQVSNLQTQANTGVNAASGSNSALTNTGGNIASANSAQGTNLGAGVVGASNAVTGNYQNQINTLLALQRLNAANVPTYNPTAAGGIQN